MFNRWIAGTEMSASTVDRSGKSVETAHERFVREMTERAEEKRLRWTDVARGAGMSVQNLLRIRKGEIAVTPYAAVGLEQVLDWPKGYIRDLLGDESGAPPSKPDDLDRLVNERYEEYVAEYGEETATELINGVLEKLKKSVAGPEETDEENRRRGAG